MRSRDCCLLRRLEALSVWVLTNGTALDHHQEPIETATAMTIVRLEGMGGIEDRLVCLHREAMMIGEGDRHLWMLGRPAEECRLGNKTATLVVRHNR